jgi:ankyrin repeat protein
MVGEVSKSKRAEGEKALWAAELGDEYGLAEALSGGGSLAVKNEYGLSALAIACKFGQAGCVRMLIDKGADVDSRDKENATPAMRAAWNGSFNCLAAVIDAGAELDARDEDGSTAAMWAALGGHADCLEALIEAGCDMDGADAGGWTPMLQAAREGHVECLSVLLRSGCDRLAAAGDGMTLAMASAVAGSLGCLELAEKSGCDWGALDESAKTALDWARDRGCEDCSCYIESCMEKRSLEFGVPEARESAAKKRI